MASCLQYVKACYNLPMSDPLDDITIFHLDCIQRMGKQVISIIISSGLINSQRCPSNRDISLSLKSLEPLLINKMQLKDKRQLYRVFGRFCYFQIKNFQDQQLLQLELLNTFFKILNISNMPKSQIPIPIFDSSKFNNNSTMCTDYTQSSIVENFDQNQRINRIRQDIDQMNNQPFSINSKIQTIQKNLDDDEDFEFKQTEQEAMKNNRELCEKHFIEVVGYLRNLSAPQAQLTFIWQHLKWQGFQTFYEPYMNDYHQWTCTAKIKFPPNTNISKEQGLWKTQKSKNKKKARQMACMDLLKTLYLQFPQVWLIYKHVREEKKLVIPNNDGPKDQDQIQLINNRKDYKIDNDKIQKLFKHSIVDIRTKMEAISAKAQLNTLLQQLAGRVTSPKIEKKMVENGNWQVPVKIEYKTYQDIQDNRPPKIYQKVITYHNTRIAEQQAYMEAIIQMYQQNPTLFEKIQSIKMAKNMIDPPKKLPLMRTLVDHK